ncbi:MAG: response regulator [Lachnospiraceae bacterium]|nr:response regulator [Lachnospiraceae bacterium]
MNEIKTLLIVDDVDLNREILVDIFEEQFNILEAENGEVAINILKDKSDDIALIFLDLQMPKKNGLDVLNFMNDKNLIQSIPVIMITGEATIDSDVKTYELGAADIIYKPFEPSIVIRRALNIIELYEYKKSIEERLNRRTRQLRESQEKLEKNNEFLVNALSSVVEFRSLESGEHIKRVKTFTGILLYHLRVLYPEYNLSDDNIKQIINASALHDIGKIAITDDILLKPGKLTPEEFEIMKTHTTKGCEILEKFKQEENDFYRYCYDICRYHHERDDGKGYPDGLKGDEIPIWAQVVSIVDVFDALVSKRVYKVPYATSEAERMILAGECGTFSDKIIACFEAAKYELFQLVDNKYLFMS